MIFVIHLLNKDDMDYKIFQDKKNFETNFVTDQPSILGNFDSLIQERNPLLVRKFGKNLSSTLFIPLLGIFCFALIVLGPYLAGFRYGLILGFAIFAAYGLRLCYHRASKHRSSLLEEIERILISIRNSLSTGQSLDFALNQYSNQKSNKPIHAELCNFVRNSNLNLIQSFPNWLKSLESLYAIPHLGRFSQLLSLELKHNTNQEEAFINASKLLDDKQRQNKKQKNTIAVSFLTMDFMVFIFLGMVFFVIPGLNFSTESNWWQSSRRELTLFVSGSILWLAYSITVFISFWRNQ